jgi:hypothetical protein
MVVFLCFSFLSMLCMSFSIVMVLLPFGLL